MQGLRSNNLKIILLTFLFSLGVLLVLGRFFYIQIIGKEKYVEKVAERFPKASVVKLSTARG
ncbi:MAG: penicillin-binding protein 2, partial [Aquificaceae bacterium]